MLTNKQTFSDVVILLAFKGLEDVFFVFTEMLWHKTIQLLLNKTTPHFQFLHKSKVDQSLLRIYERERSGSVVECLTRDRRAAGSSLTGVTASLSLSKTHLS